MTALQADAPRIILASASTARRDVLQAAGLRFEAIAAAVDEAAIKEAAQSEGIPPADAALMLAEAKAERIARRDPEALVIGCDQLLICGERWFDKPVDIAAARLHLQHLRGRTHQLVTGIVCHRNGQRIWQHVAVPWLTMRDISDSFIDAYLDIEAAHVTQSVGAYRVEGPGAQLFTKVEGEHAAILGIPLLALLDFLRQHRVLLA